MSESIKDRIARMNLEEVHSPMPGGRPSHNFDQGSARKRAPPPPPRPGQQRQQTVNNPPIFTYTPSETGNQPIEETPLPAPRISPALPPRPPPRSSTSPALPPRASPALPPRTSPSLPPRASPALPPRRSPALPPRKSSNNLQRRDSNESISTITSEISAYSLGSAISNGNGGQQLYTIRAPEYDASKLPPLPPLRPSKPPEKMSATRLAMKSNFSERPDKRLPAPAMTTGPPPSLPARQTQRSYVAPPPRPYAPSQGFNPSSEATPPVPARSFSSGSAPQLGAPPPIPMDSRPNLAALMKSKPKVGGPTGSCLKCRDFSGPDSHAARFPRTTIPSSDLGWLAVQLTSPFPSETDKARAIFTWLHHNVDYDVHSFFGGTVSHVTPENTVRSGLAVCSGYAGLFSALALKAGLESVVISGDGKGYGYTPLKPGDPIPPVKSNHAWNAVRIDNGEWKLIDCCWGAGNVQGPTEPYQRDFKPYWFTMDNNEFGLKHFPMDNGHFFRIDGRTSISWEEYLTEDVEERLTVYSNATPEHGIGEKTFSPSTKVIKVWDRQAAPDVRFQFSYICPHWDNEKLGTGKPYVMVLYVGGKDGRQPDYIPFETDGRTWWLDVDRSQLGAPGQKVSVYAVTSFNGQDARGLSYSEYKAKKGRVAMGFAGIAMWELD